METTLKRDNTRRFGQQFWIPYEKIYGNIFTLIWVMLFQTDGSEEGVK